MPTTRLPTMQRFRTTGGEEVSINLVQVGAVEPVPDGNGCLLLVQGKSIRVLERAADVVELIDRVLHDKH